MEQSSPCKNLMSSKVLSQNLYWDHIQKNGPGLVTIQEEVLPHWFMGDSGLLKIQFHSGKAFGTYKMLQTPVYKKNIEQKNFSREHSILTVIKRAFCRGQSLNTIGNSASTSILRIPNSKDFLALFEGGLSERVQQNNLKQVDFDDFGFIKSTFSAHPKVDPDNGDIFNIGSDMPSFNVFRMSKNLQLISKNSAKLRGIQSIHDCCLAGDYFIVFQCPVKVNIWKLLNRQFLYSCYSLDTYYKKTIVHIFKKKDMQLVKKLELETLEPFYIFHFTNGYSENNKIYVEYARYSGTHADKLFEAVTYAPNYAKKDGQKKKFNVDSVLQTLEINLQNFQTKLFTKDINCEFPVCEDSQVGKKWQYSYFVSKDKGTEVFDFNQLVKYDRLNDKSLIKKYENACIVEPVLIRTKYGLFILILKSTVQKCTIQILSGDKFDLIAEIQLPEFIPFGFHGKWLDKQNKDRLQTGKL